MAASIVSVPGGTPQNPASNTITIAPNASNAAKIKRRSNATNIVIENSAAGPQDSSPISAIWREVLREHVANFSYEDQKHCTAISCHVAMDKRSLEAMLSTVRPRYDAGAFNRFLDKVGLISQHILSFGRAIDVSVGGGDLTTGVIWGGVRILLEVSARTTALHGIIVDQLQNLSSYLPLFERWLKLFSATDHSDLTASIKNTCTEFLAFIVESIQFFRKPAPLHWLKMLFRPNFEKRFLACKDRIEWHTGHVKLQVNTAGFEDSKKRDDSMMALLTKNISSQQSMVKITFPFRFVQNVPRNDNFFGRGNALCDIEQHLDPGPRRGVPRMRSLVIHGLGGCGKSSVAKEYMYREYRAGKYEVIIWLYADSKDKLETQFIGLARALGIQVSEPESRHAVLNWINNFDREFLFVFDNADDPGFLKPYWPNTVRGSVLVTSRNLKVQNEGLAFVGLPLRAFGDQDGIDFLRQGLPSGFQADEDDIKALEQLTQRFGGLPLALRTAASFMTNKNCSPVKFLRLYDQRSEVIDSYQVEGYSRTVATTWTVSTSALSEASLVLLDAFSLLDPDSIPAELFDSTETHHAFAMFLDDPLAVANAQEGLTQQSLVDYDHSSRSMSVHRHLQHITLSRLVKNKTRFRQVTDLSLHLLSAYIPEFGFTSVRHPQNWKYVEHSLSHIQSVYGKCKDALTESASQKLLVCLTKSICYAYESGQYVLGVWAYKAAIELTVSMSSPAHPALSLMYSIYARLCAEMCNSKEGLIAAINAEKHVMIAAQDRPDLLKTGQYLRILTNLGILHTDAGNWDEALKWHHLAIETCINCGMQKESSLGNLTQNLAGTYLWKGELEKAEEVVRRALTEPNSTPMAANFTLGTILWKQGRIRESLDLHKQVLTDYINLLGPTHPVTANSWRRVGCLFATCDYSGRDLSEAEQCYRQACSIWKNLAARGDQDATIYHGNHARTIWSLAAVLEEQGPQHQEEVQKLRDQTKDYVRAQFNGSLPEHQEVPELLYGMIFYWDR